MGTEELGVEMMDPEQHDEGDLGLPDVRGGAYQQSESRTGPPLAYISEKLESSLTGIQGLYRWLDRWLPDDLPQQDGFPEGFDAKQDLRTATASSFRNLLKAYLALYNVLGMIGDNEAYDRLLALSTEEFTDWLGRIPAAGELTEEDGG